MGVKLLNSTEKLMHGFAELVVRCTAFTLNALMEAQEKTVSHLEASGATTFVKTLQMVQLQKAVSAVGMFSMFEAMLQDGLGCENGFREAASILEQQGDADLAEKFNDLQCAINVLKHGRGRSYDALVAKADELPFKVKRPGQSFFCEGDVSEISTLIYVDDEFVQGCAQVIGQVSDVIRSVHPLFSAGGSHHTQ